MTFGASAFGATPFGASGAAEYATGAPRLTLALTVYPREGAPRLPLVLSVFDQGAPRLTLALTVTLRSGAPRLPLALTVFGQGVPRLTLALSVVDLAGLAAQAITWRPVVRLGGVDVSARLQGTITVEAEESSARIAEFSLLPAAGPITITAWVGQTVEIDYALMAPDGSAVSPARLFTGVVDVPELELDSGRVRFECTDLLQEVIDRAERTGIDALVGGKWSEAVSGEPATNWDYAQARLASVPAALELDAWRAPRLTPWAAKAVADIELTEDDLEDGTATLTLANRSQLINRRVASFQYRFPRLQSRGITRGYKYPFDLGEVIANGYDIPTRDMIRQALDGTGWELRGGINFDPVPGVPAGSVVGGIANVPTSPTNPWQGKTLVPLYGIPVTTPDGKTAYWGVTQDVAEQLCFGFVAGLRKRWAQSVEEQYALTVEAPASIGQLGVIGDASSAAMEDDFDTAAWEAGPPKATGENVVAAGVPAQALPVLPDPGANGHSYQDGSGDQASDRAAATAAIETMVAQARVKILGSHRLHGVAAALPLDPRLDLTWTVRVATPATTAKGKLRRVRYVMDLEGGTARSEIELALSRVEATGAQTDDSVVAPAAPAAPVAPDGSFWGPSTVIATWVGRDVDTPTNLPSNATGFFTNNANTNAPSYSAAAETYPVQYIVEAPEIPADERDNKTVPIAQTYSVAIPDDELTVTIV